MRKIAGNQSFRQYDEEQAFDNTFNLLKDCLGSEAFRKWDEKRGKSVGGFSVSAFEAVALGIGYEPAAALNDCEKLSELIHGIWAADEFTANSGSGIRASSRLPKIVPYRRIRFKA